MNRNEPRIDCPPLFADYARLTVLYNEVSVGYANLNRKGDVATLADINIYDHSRHLCRFFPWLKIGGQNYQGRGFGSALLNRIITYCKEHGIREIQGKVKGDLALLIPWYEKHGFIVGLNNQIHINLDTVKR